MRTISSTAHTSAQWRTRCTNDAWGAHARPTILQMHACCSIYQKQTWCAQTCIICARGLLSGYADPTCDTRSLCHNNKQTLQRLGCADVCMLSYRHGECRCAQDCVHEWAHVCTAAEPQRKPTTATKRLSSIGKKKIRLSLS